MSITDQISMPLSSLNPVLMQTLILHLLSQYLHTLCYLVAHSQIFHLWLIHIVDCFIIWAFMSRTDFLASYGAFSSMNRHDNCFWKLWYKIFLKACYQWKFSVLGWDYNNPSCNLIAFKWHATYSRILFWTHEQDI